MSLSDCRYRRFLKRRTVPPHSTVLTTCAKTASLPITLKIGRQWSKSRIFGNPRAKPGYGNRENRKSNFSKGRAAAGVGGWREVTNCDCLIVLLWAVFIFLSNNYPACVEKFAVDAFTLENLLKGGYWLRLGAASRSVCVEKAVHAHCQAVVFKGSSLSQLVIKVNDQNGKETQESEQHRPGPRMRWW